MATYKLKFGMSDGSNIESNEFELPKGDAGEAATIEVGTTTTGNAGTDASVTNSGTSSNAVFNFTIPKGEKGDKGDKGDEGSDYSISNFYNQWDELESTNTLYIEQKNASTKSLVLNTGYLINREYLIRFEIGGDEIHDLILIVTIYGKSENYEDVDEALYDHIHTNNDPNMFASELYSYCADINLKCDIIGYCQQNDSEKIHVYIFNGNIDKYIDVGSSVISEGTDIKGGDITDVILAQIRDNPIMT